MVSHSASYRGLGIHIVEQLRQLCSDDVTVERLLRILTDTQGRETYPLSSTHTDIQTLAERLAFNQWLVQVIDMLLPDVIYLYNPQTRSYLYVNQAIRRYGYEPSAIVSGDVEMLHSHLHPDEREQILQLHHEQLERMNTMEFSTYTTEPFFDVQARMRCSDGSYRWVQDRRYVMERDEQGRVRIILGYMHDIQALREAQHLLDYHSSLEKVIAHISRMFANTSVAEIDATVQQALQIIGEATDSDRCYVFLASQAIIEAALSKPVTPDIMRDAYSWSAPGISPLRIRELNPSTMQWAFRRIEQLRSLQVARLDTLPPEAAPLRASLEAAGTKSFLVVPLHIQGRIIGLLGLSAVRHERIWSKEEVRMLRLVAETFVHAFERKVSEQLLRHSEARFRTIFDCAPLAVCILNPQGRITACNHKVEQFLGYTQEEVCNRHFLSLVRPEDRERHAEVFYELLAGSVSSYSLEIQYLHIHGSPIWTHVTASVARDIQGDISFIIQMLENINDRKIAQAHMQHYTQLISEQKSALERQSDMLLQLNGELLHKQRELEELNRSKDKFFSIISHDLRSPFSSLLGITKLLAQDAYQLERNEIHELAQTLNTQAHNVYDFIENLLKWAQAHTGRMQYHPTVVALCDIITPIEALFRENAASKSITLVNTVPETLVVYADEYMIRSVIHNLLSNALKFTDAGGSVTVCARRSVSQPKFAEISVCDTGVGMSSNDIDKLFRLDVVHTTRGTSDETGTGLGLLLCKEFVEKHGGTIWVESSEGHGTTFTFTLPLAKDTAHYN
ncbi:MAG: PAS domain S-box protein [Bacteroidota bacterium]|nr:PAS domain S-box protein [Candidatus Kapabacteria bacterium]MDW8220061.1 PAS domain S-box protein [Bacteroidota bacterium]